MMKVNLLSVQMETKWYLTRFNKIAIQGTPHMVADKEASRLWKVHSCYSTCNLPYSKHIPPLRNLFSS